MKTFRIASIAGDGIGVEVMPAGQRLVEIAAKKHGAAIEWTNFDWNCQYYAKHGAMMPADGVETMRKYDAVYLGAVGWANVPDDVSVWGLIMQLRHGLNLYFNLRPCRLLRGITSPLANRGSSDIDLLVVRENTEGEYSKLGGRMYPGKDEEFVLQQAVHSRKAIDRILRYGFELARTRRKRLTMATKSNGIALAMPYWDERLAVIAPEYPDVNYDKVHIDALVAAFVTRPQTMDVVVASNLFGDLLSDLGAGISGSIGIAPSANINPVGDGPSMFEPIHGSAPDIAGKGIANPIGQIWAGAMMLEHLGLPEAASEIVAAIETAIVDRDIRTPDLGGKATTKEMGNAIAEVLLKGV